MLRFISLAFIGLLLANCGSSVGGDRTETYLGYSESGAITSFSTSSIQLRQLEIINAVRSENGLNPLHLSAELTAAGLTHARDIAAQQRAWNFGSDKSTPQLRAERAGFYGVVTGELVSESYRGELQVMQSWLNERISRAVITDPDATDAGVAFYMEPSGKVWWVLDFGAKGRSHLGNF